MACKSLMINWIRNRHHQQVLDRAALVLPEQCGAGEHERQHSDPVDRPTHGEEPGLGQVGVEAHSFLQIERWPGVGTLALHKRLHLLAHDLTDGHDFPEAMF